MSHTGAPSIADPEERMVRRVAALLGFGEVVALGIGLPTRVADHVPAARRVTFFAENGVAGAGARPPPAAEDPDVINAGGEPITVARHGAFFDSATAFAAIRRGRLSTAVLGTLQVSERGDVASWKIPGRFSPGMGGSMELAAKARRTVVITRHETKRGAPKILPACTIPLTARAAASLIVTELALLEVTREGLLLREVAATTTVAEVRERTPVAITVAPHVGVLDLAALTPRAAGRAGGEEE